MPARSATARRWIAGALHAGLAAAFLTIATGVNGTLAAIWPHYEPIYVYLVAVVVVAALSSALLGVTAAIAAVIVYDWMFAPVRVVPSMSIAIPFAVAVIIAIVTRAAVPMLRRPALPVSVEPPLLPPIDRPAAVDRPPAVDVFVETEEREIKKLREQIATLRAQADTMRAQAENETRVYEEASTAALMREAELHREIEALQKRAEDQGSRSVAARRDFEVITRRLVDAETRATALQQGLEVAQRKADDEHARAMREAKIREQLEVAGHDSLQKAIADLSTKHEAVMLEAKQRLEVATKRFEATQKELKEERARAEREAAQRAQAAATGNEKLQNSYAELTVTHQTAVAEAKKRAEAAAGRIKALQLELDRTLVSLSNQHARADREAKLRGQLEAAARETLSRTADVSAAHQREAAEAQKTARAAEEKARTLERETEQLRSEIAGLRSGHEEKTRVAESVEKRVIALQNEMDRLRVAADEQRRQTEKGFQQRLAAEEEERAALQPAIESARHASEHERLRADLEAAAREKLVVELAAVQQALDAARSEGEEHRQRLAQEKSELELAAREAEQKHQSTLGSMKTEFESVISASVAARDATNAELRAALQRIEELEPMPGELDSLRRDLDSARVETDAERQRATRLQSERDQIARQSDENMKRIVAGITADHEDTMGDFLVDKEAAKAERRTLSHRLQEMDMLRINLDAARRELEFARAAAETERQRTTQLQAEREQMQRDFDAKLNKLVSGIAADHENSIGDFMVDKEAAKAELRKSTLKAQELQRRLDEERARADQEKRAHERLDTEWSEKLQKIVNHLAEDHEADLGEAMVQKEGARAEARKLTSRLTVLQQKIEEERDKFRQAAERWQQERSALLAAQPRLTTYTPTIEQPTPAAVTTPIAAIRSAVILVVHSDPGIRAMSKHSLQQVGYTVLTASDGLEGLRTATLHKPDVVLAEAVMPKMNARELIQLLKSKRETADVKIILLDGTAQADRDGDFRADDVIHNAADFNDLRTVLASVLSRGVAK
jgi:CheY-like chemotaxis protein